MPDDSASAGGFLRPGTPTSPHGVAQQGGFLHSLDISPPTREIQVLPRDVERDECYTWFAAVVQDGNGQLSPEELRNALLNDGSLRFSTKTVNYLMSTFDLDGSGGIGFQEFEPLWNYVTQWRKMFDSFDIDHDGRIDASGLARVLAYYGLQVGPTVINMLIKKYGTTTLQNRHWHDGVPLYVDLDQFFCVCVVVHQIYGLYERCSAGWDEQGQSPREEFLQAIISLP
ncbi:hypothetical protein BGW80DRAFT_1311900 [Lactifluus volemus]|nr:hypothetical protein BGW80DRAFT_1311900 [Lactifluus volemus]